MASIKYLNEEGLSRVADYVNAKLTFVSSMPVSPDTNQIVLYVGVDSDPYFQGGIYKFDGTDWALINMVKAIDLTQTEYDALPSATKRNGTIYFVTDATSEGGVVFGYYNDADGEFYKESTFVTQIAKNTKVLYIDLGNNTTYIYDNINDEYVQVGGGVATVIKYVTVLPQSNIEDIIYGYNSETSYNETATEGFLDTDEHFTKNGDIYTAKEGVVMTASSDGITYKDFASLAFDNSNKEFILTYSDTTTATLQLTETFYWKISARNYYAGNADEQSLTLLTNIEDNLVLDDLTDVNISSATNGQVLMYNDTDDEWKNTNLGTAAVKNSTANVAPNNHDLVESASVYHAINTALSSVYHPRGDLSCAELTSSLLIAANVGNIYEMSDAGTTTALFLQGAGQPIAIGDNVGIIQVGDSDYKFNLMANAFDLHDYQKKELDNPLTIGGVSRTEVEPALGALNTAKADKSEMTVTAGTGANADKTTIQLKEGTSATVLTAHQDLSGKVDKVSGATNGNFAGLNANGEVVDSGKKASDFASQVEVNDIVNVLGAKNLLLLNTSHIRRINAGGTWSNNVYTYNGITYTLNNDGSVLVNGTASDYSIFRMVDNSSIKFNLDSNKTYYYSGTPSSGSSFSTYYSYYSEYVGSSWTYNIDYGSGVLVTPDASATQIVVDIIVKSGQSVSNQTFKPMLRLASDPDDTYVPYAPTNAKLNEEKMSYADNGILGAKNILKNNITSVTRNGVTYTANSDGTFTANGTATAGGGIQLNANIDGSLIEGMRYKVSLDGVGADKDGSQSGIMLYVCKILNGTNIGDVARSNKTNGFTDEFVYHKDSSFDNLFAGCYTFNNASFTNSILKPMIRLATDSDDTYQPYAMTNRELTEGAGLPKKTLIRTLANGKITVTIPKNLGSSYTQGSLKLIGSNADSEAHVTFCLNADNTAVSVSKLTNLGSKALTLDSASISGNNLVLEISGVQGYAWVSAEYFMSLSAGASSVQPIWTFTGS